MLKRRILSVVMSAVFLGSTFCSPAVAAYAADDSIAAEPAQVNVVDSQVKLDVKDNKELKTKSDAKTLRNLKALQRQAKRLGIDSKGLTSEQLKASIKDAKTALVDARKLGIDVKGLSNKEVKAKVDAAKDEKVKPDTKESDEQKQLDQMKDKLKELGINVDGMSLEEINKKLNEKISKFDSDDSDTASNSFEIKSLLKATIAIRNNDKDTFMKIIQTKVFDDCLKTNISEMPYGEAKELLIKALQYHTNVDITKGTWLSVREALLASIRAGIQEEAKYYGVDITGLSDADAQAKIEAAKQIMMANELEELNKYAQLYGVDIAGLSKEEAWAKIKAIQQAEMEAGDKELGKTADFYNIDITGLSREEASEKVKYESVKIEAAKVGVDVTGLSLDEAWVKIKAAQQIIPQPNALEQDAAKFGVDITGLSESEAKSKVEEAKKAYEIANSNQASQPVE